LAGGRHAARLDVALRTGQADQAWAAAAGAIQDVHCKLSR
jgi:hypothetical protein